MCFWLAQQQRKMKDGSLSDDKRDKLMIVLAVKGPATRIGGTPSGRYGGSEQGDDEGEDGGDEGDEGEYDQGGDEGEEDDMGGDD
jgi:hypothetical protein